MGVSGVIASSMSFMNPDEEAKGKKGEGGCSVVILGL
tara:strand:+ start:680 stop:790 length:111 start_codon:yes stop_codon:yes gene_type:complete